MDKKIRLLRADEIDCRVATVSEKGVSLLLYKDARVDMAILDEVFGMFGWNKQYRMIGDSLFCQVSICDDSGRWVTKEDVGTASFAEPVKGTASDAFKRACFNIGIGRELYTAPFIWLSIEKISTQRKDGKLVIKDSFHVSNIVYDEAKAVIKGLEIQNQKNEMVFTFGALEKTTASRKVQRKITDLQIQTIHKEMVRTGITEKTICDRYGVASITDMSKIVYDRVMEALTKTKDAA